MKRYITYMLVGIISLISCSKNEVFRQQLDYGDIDGVTIKPQDALLALGDMLQTVNTKSVSDLSEDDLFVIGKNELFAETKSSSIIDIPDTLLYALNFKSGGFALMAANTRINNSVLCITESGNIGYDNVYEAMRFLDKSSDEETRTGNYAEEEDFIDAGKVYVYSLLISSAIIDYFDTKPMNYDDAVLTKDAGSQIYGPYLTTKWTQNGPFDDMTPNNYPAGCVVIAVAQIMAYNNKPASSEFITSSRPWSLLKEVYPYNDINNAGSVDAQNAVAYMSKVLGNSKNCAVDYAADGSGSNANKAKRTFENYGYKNVTKRLGCESGDIKRIDSQIASGRPVYMGGQRKGGGHAWVIDGLNGNYYHINWGWQGDCDGYYAKGVFNTSSRHSYDQIYDPGTNVMKGRNYYHYFRLLLYSL